MWRGWLNAVYACQGHCLSIDVLLVTPSTLFVCGLVFYIFFYLPFVLIIQVLVHRGHVTMVAIPARFRMRGTGIEDKSVRVVATDDVIVYVNNKNWLTSDSFAALPVDVLGTEYYVPSWLPENVRKPSQLGV
jgi:hypothetical protein